MSGDDDSSEKAFEPTERKLRRAREDGDVPVGQDLLTASVYAGVLLAAAAFGTNAVASLSGDMSLWLSAGEGLHLTPRAVMTALLPPLAPLFALPVAAALIAAVSQNALVFAPKRLRPKLSRISPLSGLKQKFGRDGLFGFAKSFAKLLAFSAILALIAADRAADIVGSALLSPAAALPHLARLCGDFLIAATLTVALIGAVDLLWQRASHRRKNRMSHKEMVDETKESEGNPYLKQARRAKAEAIATNRMLADVPTADVVITNPTHVAVALAWSRAPGSAPVCVAKGTDEVARRIREAAMAAGVPLRRDPPTARALYKSVPIGAEIAPDHYRAVAAAIRFADRIRKMARR